MFPVSNSSQTIIDCFLNEAEKHRVEVLYNHAVKSIDTLADGFKIETSQGIFQSKKVLMATGSNPKIWNLLEDLGHTIIQPVPSLFTFDIKDKRIKDIPGVVAKQVEVKVVGTDLESNGPLLITHVGMSAPAILKLSAFGAVELAKRNYNFQIEVNFISLDTESCLDELKNCKQEYAKKTLINSTQFDLPKRLWKQLILAANIGENERWADINKQQLEDLKKSL